MKNKQQLFLDLLQELNENHSTISAEYKYLGTGNPMSDMLIIGKEAAISIETEQYQVEILDNLRYWTTLENYSLDKIQERSFGAYSPLYPYRGQILKKDNGQNWGTSKTWMNYQKLLSNIYDVQDSSNINFHEKSFITEVNSTPSKLTVNADTSSISFRKQNILTSSFFQNFPIIIISGVGYFDMHPTANEIEEIFQVKFSEKKFANTVTNTQPYWLHWNKDKTKLLINTNQLSIGISDLLLTSLAAEIQESNLLK